MERYLPPVSAAAARWLRLAGLLVALGLLGWAVLDLRGVLTPLAVALAMAYVLNPLITRLERRGVRRLHAVLGLYACGTVVVLGLGLFLILKAIEQAVDLRENIGRYIEFVSGFLAHLGPTSVPATASATPRYDWWKEVAPLAQQHGLALANSTLGVLTGFFSNMLNWLSIFVLIPLFAFSFLWKFDSFLRSVRDHLPAASRDVIIHLTTTIDRAMATFFRGRLIVCIIVALASALGWTLAGVPLALALGLLAGVLNLVPYLSLLALPPALLSAYFDAVRTDDDWKLPVLLAMGVYLAVQALETFVLTPTIESRASGLHPLTTVVALLIGAHWAGLLGLLLAIPVASTLKTLAAEFVLPELRRLAQSPTRAREEEST